jgi:uncharacterized RDD family membrane protein YckC
MTRRVRGIGAAGSGARMGSVWVNEVSLTEGVVGRRVVGWVIDAVILGVCLLVLKLVLFLFGLITFGIGWYLYGGLWIVPAAYSFLWVASDRQASPGQMLMDLRVARDADLGRPSPAQALVYAGGFWLSMAAGAVWLLVALVTNRNRCLHDIASGLAVVRARTLTDTNSTLNMAGGSFDR